MALYDSSNAFLCRGGRSGLDGQATSAMIKSIDKLSFTYVCQVKRLKLKIASFPTPKIHIPSDDYLFFDVTKPIFDLDVQLRLKALSQLSETSLNGIESIDLGINFMTVKFNSLAISPTHLAEWLRQNWQSSWQNAGDNQALIPSTIKTRYSAP